MRGRIAVFSAAIALAPSAALAGPFTYEPPGELLPDSGEGLVDSTVYAPGIRFPIEEGPAFANSQVYGPGGSLGPGGGQCDASNYDYPWRDNYCEIRTWDMPLCPAGTGHQGQDVRPGTCDKDVHWAVAVVDGTITQVGSYTVYITAADGTRFDYLHMDSVQVSVGEEVTRGQRLGRVSNNFGGTATTIHLHFNIMQNVEGLGFVFVPPYMSLVKAYETLLPQPPAGSLDDADCATVTGWAHDGNTPDAHAQVTISFDGALDDPDVKSITVTADEVNDDLCEPLGSCDHGFSAEMPADLDDGKPHVVHAYGLDTEGGVAAELMGSPKTVSCVHAPGEGGSGGAGGGGGGGPGFHAEAHGKVSCSCDVPGDAEGGGAIAALALGMCALARRRRPRARG